MASLRSTRDGMGYEELAQPGSQVADVWLTGSVTTESNITAGGDISGANVYAGTSVQTPTITATTLSGTNVFAKTLAQGATVYGTVVSGANIYSAGVVTAQGAVSGANVYSTGTIQGDNVLGDTMISGAAIYSAGTITATGQINATNNNFSGANAFLGTAVQAPSIVGTTSVSGADVYAANCLSGGTATIGTTIKAGGAISGANVYSTGDVLGLTHSGGYVLADVYVRGNTVWGPTISGGIVNTGSVFASNIISGLNVYATGDVQAGSYSYARWFSGTDVFVSAGVACSQCIASNMVSGGAILGGTYVQSPTVLGTTTISGGTLAGSTAQIGGTARATLLSGGDVAIDQKLTFGRAAGSPYCGEILQCFKTNQTISGGMWVYCDGVSGADPIAITASGTGDAPIYALGVCTTDTASGNYVPVLVKGVTYLKTWQDIVSGVPIVPHAGYSTAQNSFNLVAGSAANWRGATLRGCGSGQSVPVYLF